jgi:hypothetical protein
MPDNSFGIIEFSLVSGVALATLQTSILEAGAVCIIYSCREKLKRHRYWFDPLTLRRQYLGMSACNLYDAETITKWGY